MDYPIYGYGNVESFQNNRNKNFGHVTDNTS